MDGRCRRLVHSPRLVTRLLHLFPIAALAVSAAALGAEPLTPEQAQRARLLEQALQEGRVSPSAPAAPNVLRGASLDAPPASVAMPAPVEDPRTRQYREQLDLQRSTDLERRQLLGDQQTGRLRAEVTGIPDISAPARTSGFERDQRMRDLSLRMQQQDRQYRLNGQNPR